MGASLHNKDDQNEQVPNTRQHAYVRVHLQDKTDLMLARSCAAAQICHIRVLQAFMTTRSAHDMSQPDGILHGVCAVHP